MVTSRPPPPLIAVVGPTATGKSALALTLAREMPVEILAADSRQVYRGMDVGTAKPTAAQRAQVPHHLLDLADPDERFTVADWLGHARAAVDAVLRRGRMPMLVGGTGLYVASLVDGYDFGSRPWSPELRERLAAELEAEGLPALAARLAELDPTTAARTDVRNPRRVLSALERIAAGGGGAEPRSSPWSGRVALVGIARPRPVVYRRIDTRAVDLFATGLVEEVRGLLAAGYAPDLPAMSGHGYREAARIIAGTSTLEEAIADTARRTRQYAKRQLSWFGRDPRIVWIPAGTGPADAPSVVRRAADAIRRLLA